MTENKKSRLAYLLGWLVGIFFLIVGLMGLSDSIIGGLLIMIGAILLLPVSRKIKMSRWKSLGIGLVLIIIGIGLSISGNGGTSPFKTSAPLSREAVSAAMGGEFTNAAVQTLAAYEALTSRQYGLAKRRALDVKDTLERVQKLLSQNREKFNDEEAEDITKSLQVFQEQSTLIYKTSALKEESEKVLDEIEGAEDIAPFLPRLELLSRGHKENSEDWRQYALFLESIEGTTIIWPVDQRDVDTAFQIAQVQMSFAQVLDENLETFKNAVPDYTSIEERVIPSTTSSEEELDHITNNLEAFFDSFDLDGDNKLSIGEAQEFYYWVENNIVYRYDYEEEMNPVVGTLVGDGRAGADYRQTPIETMQELAGDCEDMATLEQAFYRYYGIDAYVVGVNAIEPDVLDHAAAIVWIADKTDLFKNTLGDLVYYEFDESAKDTYGGPIKPGVYMLVDNSYSGAFGYLSGGLEPGTFRIHCAIPLDKGYDDWSDVVGRCGVPMD